MTLVPFVLCVLGTGMIIGNIVGSRLADRALLPTIGGVLVWNAVMLIMLAFTASHAWLAVINVLLIGTGFAHVPAVQTQLMDVASRCADAGGRPQPFRIQYRKCAWCVGRRPHDRCRLWMDVDRMGRRVVRARGPCRIRNVAPG
jgi:hypothetical protein